MGFTGFLLITSKFEELDIKEVNDNKEEHTLHTIANENSYNLISNGVKKDIQVNNESFKEAFISLKYWHTMGLGFFNVCNIFNENSLLVYNGKYK